MIKKIAKVASCNTYAFVFCGGTCGSFAKAIWGYYLGYTKILQINPLTGDAHGNNANNRIRHYHDWDSIMDLKKTNPAIKIILINFDLDDLDLITEMQYFKFTKQWLESDQNLKYAIERWPAIAEGITNPLTRRDTWEQHIKKGYEYWLNNIEIDLADYIINFKTIYGKNDVNLNRLIAKYLNTTVNTEVDTYINEYRLVNYRLYGN